MIDLELIAVGSEGDKSQQLCENHGFAYVEHDNMPLNRKYNAASRLAQESNPDAVYRIDSGFGNTSIRPVARLWFLQQYKENVGMAEPW